MIRVSMMSLHGLAWAAAAIGIWSGSLVMLRLGVTTGLNAWDLAALRFGTAAVFLLPVVVRHGFGLRRPGPAPLATMVVGFGAPYIVLISFALTSAPASAAGALNPGVMAVTTVLLGRWVLDTPIGPMRTVGSLLVLAGCVAAAGGADDVTIGDVILFGTGILWAGYALTVRRYGVPALHATALVAVWSAILYLPVYALVLPHRMTHAGAADIVAQMVFQGLLVSLVAVFAFNRSIELLGPVTGGALPALIPIATLGIGALTLGESAGPVELASAATIGAGVVLILVDPNARR